MQFTHTEERQMLADMAGRFVREQYPIDKRHEIAASDGGISPEMWEQMAELGLIGALFPEELGGFGGSGFDVAVIFEEIGRGLVVEPFLPNMLAGLALAEGSDAQKAVIDEVIAGSTRLAYAHGEPASRYTLDHVETNAAKTSNGYVLNGNKAVVLGGDNADHLVVSAKTDNGISLFFVPADATVRRDYSTVDGYRAAEIALKDVAVGEDALIGVEGSALPSIKKINAYGALAVSAEALGAIEVAIDLTLDYLKTRKQFGVVIGKFQALQHRMADMMGEREQIRSALINAAGHMESDERDWYVSALKNLVGRSGRMIAEEAIQMHGGIGMTWEYAVGHYAKRIVMIDHMFGDVDHHLEQIIKLGKG
ncbi:acyl-CoA dehydrogenase family protein [Pseudahrensia aquimaris]|uniref:Acyl-CoA dehydrogenase family protein n=1 Tax=Pseudahrensia aquimaris TaxID=744461 RepID=A0ABW3FBH9_9HYPH